MNDFAIVILNYNGVSLLQKFLPKIDKFSKDAAVYIIDNNSSDNSKRWVTDTYPHIKWIQLNDNYGYAKGYNLGLKQVQEPLLCLLNSDIEVTENWLTPIYNIFKNNEQIGIIQPKIRDYKSRNKLEYAGAAGGFIDELGFPYCRGRIFNTIEIDTNQYESTKIFWASGACFFIRKQVFDTLSGFDEYFFAHQEEIDLCWRAFNQNIEAFYCNQSIVYHVGGASLNKNNPKKTFLNFRNSLIMLSKNLPKKHKFFKIYKRLCYDGVAGIKLLVTGKPLHCWAVGKAHFAFYYYLLFETKQVVFGNKKENYYHTKNIVKSHFIDKKNNFNEL